MNNKEELIKLIQENPKLPFVFMVNNDEIADGYGCTVMENFKVYISEIYEYEAYGDKVFTDDLYDIRDYYYCAFADNEEYKDLFNEEYEKAINDWIDENIVHYKAIVLYVS